MAGCGEGRLDHAGAGGAARRGRAGESPGARRLHQRGPGAADPESAAGAAQGRSDLAIVSSHRRIAETHSRRIKKPEVTMSRPPLPPFTRETAAQKARMAEDAWNSRDPERVALAYTEDSRWRNRSEFFEGRAAIVAFLTRKWAREHDYRLIK